MRTILLTLITCFALSAHGQKKQHIPMNFDMQESTPTGSMEIYVAHDEPAKFIMQYDFMDSPLVVKIVNHKPVANKPYTVFVRNHSLIIFCRGVKMGAVKWLQKPYQLTNLKLN